jgi:hypothetical protein
MKPIMVYIKLAAWPLLVATLGVGNVMAIEEAEYTVVLKEQDFELRSYESHILAETIVKGDFEDAGDKAFSRLFKYISGNNKSRENVKMTSPVAQSSANEKIAMTSPVGQQREAGRWAVSFMMPASYTLATTPEPKDPSVKLRMVAARYIASVEYTGFWSEKAYQKNRAKLETWMNQKELTVIGEAIWARYNPPFMPWFLRRNEILVPVTSPREGR